MQKRTAEGCTNISLKRCFMGKVFCLIGPSSSGKDTVYREIMSVCADRLKKIVPYTTRPAREGEQDGVQYYFTDESAFQGFKASGRVIEDRCYDTFYGKWRYFTVDDGQIDIGGSSYLVIATIESYLMFRDYFGDECVVPVYIELDPGIRLQRALDRENRNKKPGYEEMCRRFLADSRDFSEAKISEAGIARRFNNSDLNSCVNEIVSYIDSRL